MNNEFSAARGVAIVLSGAVSACLWLSGLAQWAMHVETPFLFPALRRVSGSSGPWMAAIGDVLYATLSATVAVLLVASFFKPWARSKAALFLIGFCLVHAAIAVQAGTAATAALTAGALWLFVAWFAVFAALRPRP